MEHFTKDAEILQSLLETPGQFLKPTIDLVPKTHIMVINAQNDYFVEILKIMVFLSARMGHFRILKFNLEFPPLITCLNHFKPNSK